MRLLLAVSISILALTACGVSDEPDAEATQSTQESVPEPPTNTIETSAATTTPAESGESSDLRAAVQAYSDAFLAGQEDEAFGLLSRRCQEVIGEESFDAIVDQAEDLYGSALDIETYEESVDGDSATVTYTYAISAIDQADEPWVREGGAWRNDEC